MINAQGQRTTFLTPTRLGVSLHSFPLDTICHVVSLPWVQTDSTPRDLKPVNSLASCRCCTCTIQLTNQHGACWGRWNLYGTGKAYNIQ